MSQLVIYAILHASRILIESFTVPYEQRRREQKDSPHHHLEDPEIARLFHSYISYISHWYDLADSAQSFHIRVPVTALEEPLLFYAVIALSAMHAYRTSTERSLPTAEFYHAECVRLLISLEEQSALVLSGVALAVTCLLRSYEILTGESIWLYTELFGFKKRLLTIKRRNGSQYAPSGCLFHGFHCWKTF